MIATSGMRLHERRHVESAPFLLTPQPCHILFDVAAVPQGQMDRAAVVPLHRQGGGVGGWVGLEKGGMGTRVLHGMPHCCVPHCTEWSTARQPGHATCWKARCKLPRAHAGWHAR